MHALVDQAGVSSPGRLCRQTSLGTSHVEIVGSDRLRSCALVLFLTVWFQRKRDEALLSIAII
jgi:hypothetical protein